MATDLKLYFTNTSELYNAVYFANAIGDANPGVYNITLQATATNQVPNQGLINLNQYGATLDANERQAVIANLINTQVNEIFDSSIVATSEEIISDSIREQMFGFAPAIRHDLTINFRLESDPTLTFAQAANRLQLITDQGQENPNDYQQPTDLAISFLPQSQAGLLATGFKIDDGNSAQQINVTLNGLKTNYGGGFFFESDFPLGGVRSQFSDVGVLIDNYENLTINGMVLGPTSVIGNPSNPQIVPAQVINRPSGNLTLTGDIVIAPALNYTNSLAYNQGTLAINNADIRIFDKNSPEVITSPTRFGNAERAVGAINNLGTLTISNSQLFQEADNKVNANSLLYPTAFNSSVFGITSDARTPNWRAPVTLEYLLSNSGSASISNSVIAGILRQQGSSTASLSLQSSNLGYGETPKYDNLFIGSGSYSVNTSTIDRISTAIRPSQLSNSVILSSAQPSVVAASDDIAYRTYLDPTRPSLYAASKEDVGLLNPEINNPRPTGEFWRSTYNPTLLNPAVQAAVTAALQSSSGGGSTGGGGGSTGGGGSSGSGGGSGSAVQPPATPGGGAASTPGLDNDNLDESPENHNGLVIDANKDGIPDASQSNVAGIKRVGDGTSQGDYAALAVPADYTLNAVTLLPITNNQVQVSLPNGGSVTTPIPNGIKALLEPLEFYVENVKPGATIEAELFIPDNFDQQTDAYMRFNYQSRRFEEYVDVNSTKLYQLLDENADGKVDRVIFSLTDGDPRWDGDAQANGVIIDPGSPIDAQLHFSGRHRKDTITGNLLGNAINGKTGNDRLFGDLGKDRIRGGKGHDHITGGEQGDLLIGGRGRDRFIYTSAADSSADNPNQQDEIRRFHHQDRLDLKHFDADTTQAGKQAFTFIGARSFSGDAGALRFHAGLLSADLDGDRTAEFAVAIDGALRASQLIL